ncbi:MAG: DUF177 domain-containing protein [Deltaproteobacteria bacterium]|nr:DUF177 domain-containing protein [Deltaproteobacteria bacterium]
MKVKITQIQKKNQKFSFALKRSDCQRVEDRYHFDKIDCLAELTKNHEQVQVKGSYKVVISSFCDQCLGEISQTRESQFQLFLLPESAAKNDLDDREITLSELDIDYFAGLEIDLGGYFEDQVILDTPLVQVCSENCAGICNQCGVNLNFKQCDCRNQGLNNPFRSLRKNTDNLI